MKAINRIRIAIATAIAALLVSACGIYSFSGTSVAPDVHTVTINLFEYTALRVNPNLSSELTELMKEKFRKMTRLEQVDMDGDLEIAGTVTGYDVSSGAVTAGEVASQNRLTVTVHIEFTNRKHPEENFEKNFSAYSDYDSMQTLDAVEGALCEDIEEKLCEDILNATVANW